MSGCVITCVHVCSCLTFFCCIGLGFDPLGPDVNLLRDGPGRLIVSYCCQEHHILINIVIAARDVTLHLFLNVAFLTRSYSGEYIYHPF